MRRAAVATPRMDLLRAHLFPHLARRGAASELARLWSPGNTNKREQISVWFKKRKGLPTAIPTLLAVQFLMAQPEWPEEEFYVPTWDELVRIVTPLLSVRGKAADLARFCGRKPFAVSRYFSRKPRQRREPDGEVALATLDWLSRRRVEGALVENGSNPKPPLEVWRTYELAFAIEQKLRERRERVEGRELPLLGTNLFND